MCIWGMQDNACMKLGVVFSQCFAVNRFTYCRNTEGYSQSCVVLFEIGLKSHFPLCNKRLLLFTNARHSFNSDLHQQRFSSTKMYENCGRLPTMYTVQHQVTQLSQTLIYIVTSHHQGLCILFLAVGRLVENTIQASFKCESLFLCGELM